MSAEGITASAGAIGATIAGAAAGIAIGVHLIRYNL